MELIQRELQFALSFEPRNTPQEPPARNPKTPKKVKLKGLRNIGSTHGDVIGSPQSELTIEEYLLSLNFLINLYLFVFRLPS